MKLKAFKSALANLNEIKIVLPNGQFVPAHFHITEVGQNTRHFIDCGGTERIEKKVNFQLWEDEDLDHRLAPSKLLSIIELSEAKIGIGDHEIEVEYQGTTIGKYGLELEAGSFNLVATHTDCLAKDKCGIAPKAKLAMADLSKNSNSCEPGSGCC
jgi:hypothetical protein